MWGCHNPKGNLPNSGYSPIQGWLNYHNHLVLPSTSSFTPLVLHKSHDNPIRGYLGELKTLKQASPSFYWPRMKLQVQAYAATCLNISTKKTPHCLPMDYSNPYLSHIKFRKISYWISFQGLPKSEEWDTIFVVVDRLSKYAHCISLKHPLYKNDVAIVFVWELIQLHKSSLLHFI